MSENSEVIQIHDSESSDSSSQESNSDQNGQVHEINSSDEDSEIECIEEESESEPDLDCDQWDEDCKILTYACESQLQGYHSKEVMNVISLEPPTKKGKFSLQISECFTAEAFFEDFQDQWKTDKNVTQKNLQLFTDPFKICVFHNYVQDQVFLDKLRLQFNEIAWNKRTLDLYEFFQSQTLKNCSSEEYVKIVYDFLKDDVRAWLTKLTGIELTTTSATCSFYGHTDFLLLHDDLQDDRMFAFVLYLTGPENWDSSWGGALQLFSSNDQGHPDKLAKSIYPENNQLVIFPVTNRTYHQVEEVLSKNYSRLSINGWFHAADVPKFDMPVYVTPKNGLFSDNRIEAVDVDSEIQTWIKQNYLQNHVTVQIQKHIEEYSEISLEDFFIESRFQEILTNLDSPELKWKDIGPPNRKRYSVLIEEDLPEVLRKFIEMFKSNEMFSLLHSYTDLELTSGVATMRYELQKWQSGSYSLLSDHKWEETEELDVILYMGCKRGSIVGGKTVFVSLDEQIQESLITIEPIENNFNLIYRDSARYTQYVSKESTVPHFYLLICSYSES